MTTEYRLKIKATDPMIKLQLPLEILEDIATRAEIQGLHVDTYIARTLARSLSNFDEEMQEHIMLQSLFSDDSSFLEQTA